MGTNLRPFDPIFEDEHILAVVKPAGLPTANAASGEASVFRILQVARPGRFLGVVSRLDAPVSGVLVLATSRPAAAELARQFRDRLVRKTYLAVVEGRFPAPLGQWVDWHDRLQRLGEERRSRLLPSQRTRGPVTTDAGPEEPGPEDSGDDESDELPGLAKECHVRARVVKRSGEVSLVELEPTTGRRHQLRAQLAGRGCAIVGDRTYGSRLPFAVRGGFGPAIALHASSLELVHPGTGRVLFLTADWPLSWRERFQGLGTAKKLWPDA